MDFTFERLSWGDICHKFEKVYNSNLFRIPGNYADVVRQHFRDIINEVAADWLYPADDLVEESDTQDLIDEDLVPKISKSLNEALEQNVLDNIVSTSTMDPNPSSVGNLSMSAPSILTQDLSSKNEIDGDSVSKLSKSLNEVFKKNSSENIVSNCHTMDPNPLSVGNSTLIAPSSLTEDLCSKNKIDEQKSETLPTEATNCSDVIEENSEFFLSAAASLDATMSTSAFADENLKTCGNTEDLASVRSCLVNEHELLMEQDKLETDETGFCQSKSVEGMLPIESCETEGITHSWLKPTFPTGCPINMNELLINHGKSEGPEMDCCQSKSVEDYFDEGVNSKTLPEEFEDVDLSDCREEDKDFQLAFISYRESRPSSFKKKLGSSIIKRFRKLTGQGREATSSFHNIIIREQGRQGNHLPPADSKKCCVGQSLELDWEMI